MREIRIDLAAIRKNYLELKKLVAPAKVMAVVKANAYGHGMIQVAKALEDEAVDMIGVADLTEAIALRQAGISSSLMCWLLDSDDNLDLAEANEIALGISTMQQLELVPSSVSIHIKVDTGLGRNGFMPNLPRRLLASRGHRSTPVLWVQSSLLGSLSANFRWHPLLAHQRPQLLRCHWCLDSWRGLALAAALLEHRLWLWPLFAAGQELVM